MPENPVKPIQNEPELAIPKDKLILLPFYHELENEIKQSERVRLQTDYFWRKWAPKLGPTLTVLIIALRSYCYYNRVSREKRDWCYPEQKTLADDIGVSVDTIQRELKKPVARYFVRREARYRFDDDLKRPVRTADTYFVSMDDPMTPEDLQFVAETAKKRLESNDSDGKPQNAAYREEPVDNLSGKPQSAVHNTAAESQSGSITPKKDLITLSKDIRRPLSGEEESIVQEILSVCRDDHSRRFYESVARTLPTHRIWSALSEVKDAAATGRLKKSKGAYFTSLVRQTSN